MPVVKISKSGEQEALTGTGGIGQGDLNRLTTNLASARSYRKIYRGPSSVTISEREFG